MSTVTSTLSDYAAMTQRGAVKNRRKPEIVIWGTLAPVGFALLFAFVLGSAIDVPGSSYREFLIAGILAQSMLMTATNTGVGVAEDLKNGLVDRFRSLPASPSALLVGRTTSDLLVNAVVVLAMTVTGLLIGWRIRGSLTDALLAFALLLAFAYAVSWVAATIGLSAGSPEALSSLMMMFMMPATFISNAFVPTEGLPGPLRVIADWSPVSALIASCRELFGNVPAGYASSDAWPMQHPIAATLAWIVVLLAIFVPLATHRFRRAVG